jgi:hypothetical protein
MGPSIEPGSHPAPAHLEENQANDPDQHQLVRPKIFPGKDDGQVIEQRPVEPEPQANDGPVGGQARRSGSDCGPIEAGQKL